MTPPTFKPTNLYAALRDQELFTDALGAEAFLNQFNPILRLNPKSYRETLRLLLQSTVMLRGPLVNKTYLELAQWLRVLDGELSLMELEQQRIPAWTWEQLAELDIEPMLAACYMRMVRDKEKARVEGVVPC